MNWLNMASLPHRSFKLPNGSVTNMPHEPLRKPPHSWDLYLQLLCKSTVAMFLRPVRNSLWWHKPKQYTTVIGRENRNFSRYCTEWISRFIVMTELRWLVATDQEKPRCTSCFRA